MKKVLIALAAAVVLVVVALLVVPSFIPVETYKAQITQAARDATGRDLTISGDMRLSLLPRLELEAADVAFANAPGAAQADMVSLDKLLVQLQVFPLISGEVRVDSFILVEPVIHLEVDKNGRPNWQFAEAGTGGTPSTPTQPSGGPGDVPEISLGDVRLEDGLVTYSDARNGQTMEISAINMTVSLPDMDSPVAADGSLIWNGKKLSLNVESEALRGLMNGQATLVSLGLESDVVNLTYQGSVSKAAPARIDGDINLDVPSIRALAAWTGTPIEMEGSGLGPLKIEGKVEATPAKVAFTEAKLTLDDIHAEGDLTADISRGKPDLTGHLDVDRVDLNVYAPPAKPQEGASSASSGASSSGGGQSAAPADWSDEPIDLTALKAVNVDFALSVGEILAQDVKIGRSTLTTVLKDGLLVLDLTELSLYGGSGKGKVTVDARGKVPAVEKTFSVEAIQAQPLFSDAAGFDRLEGTGAFNISAIAKGNTQRQMVRSLNGKGAFKFLDGAVRGLNLAAMVRNVGTAFLDKDARQSQKTDFAELSGTFTITNGIVRNDDLSMRNPLLRVTGAGSADAPKRTVNYRIEPKVVGSLEGQGTASDAKGVSVPVIVEGPWNNVTYRPDLAGLVTDIAKDPAKALEGAKDVLKQLKGGESGEGAVPDPSKVLKKLFGD